MQRYLLLGTAGHIDHGKTSLIQALTGVNTDRLPEEKRRGITVELGFAALELEDLLLGVVDVPGHERFTKNMLAGAQALMWHFWSWQPTRVWCLKIESILRRSDI